MKAVSQHVPDPGISRCAQLVGSKRSVLLAGDAVEELLQVLDQQGCSISCILTGSMDEDEARIFATHVTTAAPSDLSVPVDFRSLEVDAVVLCDPYDRLDDLANLLHEARALVVDGGVVIAGLGSPRFDIFTRAGYVIEGADEMRSIMGSLFVTARPAAAPQTSAGRDTAQTVEALYLELEREQAARRQLLDALAAAERSATEIQRKATDIAARRSDYELQARALLTTRKTALRLHLTLLIAQRAVDAAQRDAANAEAAWYALLTQLENTRADADKAFAQMRAMLENARRDRDLAKARVERLAAAEASSTEHAAELQCRVSELERELAAGAEYVQQLLSELDAIRSASLADKAVMQAYAADVRERSEHTVAELRGELAAARDEAAAAAERERLASEGLTERVDDLQAALRQTELRLNGENRELRERVASAEAMLSAQTDAVIATMQTESAHLSTLVDTVQSSRFWRFKRWLNRLLGTLRS